MAVSGRNVLSSTRSDQHGQPPTSRAGPSEPRTDTHLPVTIFSQHLNLHKQPTRPRDDVTTERKAACRDGLAPLVTASSHGDCCSPAAEGTGAPSHMASVLHPSASGVPVRAPNVLKNERRCWPHPLLPVKTLNHRWGREEKDGWQSRRAEDTLDPAEAPRACGERNTGGNTAGYGDSQPRAGRDERRPGCSPPGRRPEESSLRNSTGKRQSLSREMEATGRGPDRERSQEASSAHREVNKDRKAEEGSQEEESRSESLGDAIYKQPERVLEIMAGQQRPDSQGLTSSQEVLTRAGMRHGGL